MSGLPQPWEAVAVIAKHLLETLVWLLVTPSQNVAELGLWWVPFYWLLVYISWSVGAWGSVRMRQIRRGADFFEFDPERRGGAWAGRLAVGTIRLQVAGEAWAASLAVIGGYGTFLTLLTVGLLWRWLPLLGVGVLWWLWRARTRPAWWDQP